MKQITAAVFFLAFLILVPWAQAGPPELSRVGVGLLGDGTLHQYPVSQVPFGWYHTWAVGVTPERPGGAEFVQTIRLYQYVPTQDMVTQAAQANPGSIWFIGNEPDNAWQDALTPEQYAVQYHDWRLVILNADPTARIAIAGVTQPTPLRMQWLDRTLSAYQRNYGTPMPVDVWNVHGYILREATSGQGCGIPVGISATSGQTYYSGDSLSIDKFKAQIVAFRKWMAARGYRDKPLIVSEYGVLFPESFFADGMTKIKQFMTGTMDWMNTATDTTIGYPADNNRLVQRWAWFAFNCPDRIVQNAFLCDPETYQVTEYGRTWGNYLAPGGVPVTPKAIVTAADVVLYTEQGTPDDSRKLTITKSGSYVVFTLYDKNGNVLTSFRVLFEEVQRAWDAVR